MLYFKYRKFVRIFDYVKRLNRMEHLDFILEQKFGKDAKEAISILKARGGLYMFNIMSFSLAKDEAKIDAAILEYNEKSSAMFWGFVKWTIGTAIAIVGAWFAYRALK